MSNLGSASLHAKAARTFIDAVEEGGCGSFARGCNATHPCSWMYWRESVSRTAAGSSDTGVRVIFGNLETRLSGGESSLLGDASTWRDLTVTLRLTCDLGLAGDVNAGDTVQLQALPGTESD